MAAVVGQPAQSQAFEVDYEDLKEAFASIRAHENDHVKALLNALGKHARPKPHFKNLAQPNFKAFVVLSQALENTGVGAYLGATPAIHDYRIVAAAGSIAFIEARHASFLNFTLNDPLTGGAKDSDSDRSFETKGR